MDQAKRNQSEKTVNPNGLKKKGNCQGENVSSQRSSKESKLSQQIQRAGQFWGQLIKRPSVKQSLLCQY